MHQNNKNSEQRRPVAAALNSSAWPSAVLFARIDSTFLLLMVFLAVIVVGIYVGRDLHSADIEARKMYAGSVLGIRRIGDIAYQAQETRRSTFYALSTKDSNLQIKYADQSRAADDIVTAGIVEYLREERTQAEQEVGHRLQREWADYLQVRDEVLASILEGSTQEAVDRDLTTGVPLFDRVREDLDEINRLYDAQAFQRLTNVAASSQRSMIRLASVLGTTLLLAFLSVWAIQRSRVSAAMDLAKLQMEFVASVSHELRTPLAVISSAADNIADGLVSGKEEQKKYGIALQNQSRQMAELVNQILLFAATKDPKVPYASRTIRVSDLVDSAVSNTLDIARNAGFTLQVDLDPELPPLVGDLSALSQCLQNLIGNALKYSGESRWIGIRAMVEPPKTKNGRRQVLISVEDRGIGIDSSELANIFQPFYRSAAVTAEQIHGTGLGLSLSRNIAEGMGGRLEAYSQLGVGSTFTLRMPAFEDPAHRSSADDAAAKGMAAQHE